MVVRFLLIVFVSQIALVQARVQIVDDIGTEIVLEQPAMRIVSLAPHLTELLFSIGVGDRIIGTVRFSDYPPAALDIPVLGDAFTMNIESIAALKPDMVVAWQTGGTATVVEKLRQLGINVFINEASDLASIAASTHKLSILVGRETEGKKLQESFLARLDALDRSRQSAAIAGHDAIRVFFQISDQGLYTVNDKHLIGQAMSVCGVQNIYGESMIPVPIVSKESVLSANPDVIVISQPLTNVESPWVEKWSEIPGFGSKIRLIDPALISRPSLRMVQGIEELCRLVVSTPGVSEVTRSASHGK